MDETLPEDAETVVIGAGPQALALVLHLLDARPSAREGLVVLDPAGRWLAEWEGRFARLAIDQLRSPGVHHPAPDAGALGRWSRAEGRPAAGPYGIPRAGDFVAFCHHLVAEAEIAGLVTGRRAHLLSAGADGVSVLAGDTTVRARRVVVAADPHHHRLPSWLTDLLPRRRHQVDHAANVDLRGLDLSGEEVVVVGGGLTAGHLVVGALAAGAERVHLVVRRVLRQQMFDTDPGWLGPRCLAGFQRLTSWEDRHDRVLAARDGGSLPPWMWRRLAQAAVGGRLALHERARVVAAGDRGGRVDLVLGDERHLVADRVWLATGTQPDLGAGNLFEDLCRTHPCPVVGGYPGLGPDLAWPGVPVHLMGRPAALALGPAAGNLWGARVAATRIVGAWCGDGAVATGAEAARR